MAEVEVLDQVVPDLVDLEEVVVELLFSTLQAVLEEEEEVVPLRGEEVVLEVRGVGEEEPPWKAEMVSHQTGTKKDLSWKLF